MKMSPEKINVHGNASRQMPQVTGKTIIAGGLVLMLAFMWIRVFIGGSDAPDEVDASVFAANGGKSQNTVMKLKRLPLPFEFGRHDRLTTDMFASRDMEIGKDASSKGGKDRDEKIKSQKDAADKLADKLELDAIILGADKFSHKAFINGKLHIAGDELVVKLNDKKYEMVVMEIYHNKVVLKWNEYTISVRLANLDNVK